MQLRFSTKSLDSQRMGRVSKSSLLPVIFQDTAFLCYGLLRDRLQLRCYDPVLEAGLESMTLLIKSSKESYFIETKRRLPVQPRLHRDSVESDHHIKRASPRTSRAEGQVRDSGDFFELALMSEMRNSAWSRLSDSKIGVGCSLADGLQWIETFGENNVGLLTGDSAVNKEAQILIMTTEILRNMLYQSIGMVSSGSGLFHVDVIVLDEVHYLSDISRGTVWEEIVIYCPKEVQLICLSATVANPDELAGWIGQEISWKQKSRIQWLKEGDRNTKFFHCMAKFHRKSNLISSLIVDGERKSDPKAIEDSVIEFYKDLYSEKVSWRPKVDGLPFDSVSQAQSEELERPFQEEEVLSAIQSLATNKAPGSDGFSIEFYEVCWDIVGGDLLAVLRELHVSGSFDRAINNTFVTLIPKRAGAQDLKEFRPISLVSSAYKILAKVLALRIRGVLGSLISPNQGAFVQGRQILDGVLIANECVDERLKSKIPGLICKIDVEKAYDNVNWEFLLYVLGRMGFRPKWRLWIKACISSASFSILLNGSSKGFFRSSKRLRQGDLLYPALFIIVLEALSRMLVCANGQALTGFSMGLRVNLSKSEIIPVGDIPHLDVLVSYLGCQRGSLPSTYLGLPLGTPFKSTTVWNPIIERFSARLAGWKSCLLSKGGRLTLIQSTLRSLPTYYLSLITLPRSVAVTLTRLQRNFLWHGKGDKRKYHLVDWAQICKPLAAGGLNLAPLSVVNKALLGKWVWRFGEERESLWNQVVVARHGLASRWISRAVRGSHGVGLWKGIMGVAESLDPFIRFQLGNGAAIQFWLDVWCGQSRLKDDFVSIFSLALNKGASVAEYAERLGSNSVWCPRLRRALNEWEIEDMQRLLSRHLTLYFRVPFLIRSIEEERVELGQQMLFVSECGRDCELFALTLSGCLWGLGLLLVSDGCGVGLPLLLSEFLIWLAPDAFGGVFFHGCGVRLWIEALLIRWVKKSSKTAVEEEMTCVSATNQHKMQLDLIHGTTELVTSTKRPVPLTWHFSTKNSLLPLLNEKGTSMNRKLSLNYLQLSASAINSYKEDGSRRRNRKRESEMSYNSVSSRSGQSPLSKNDINAIRRSQVPQVRDTLWHLRARDMLPAIWFIFSRKGCDASVQYLEDCKLLDECEMGEVELALKRFRIQYPDAVRESSVKGLLQGVAAHHAGCLPLWKSFIEELFQRGLVKIVFATETLAAGINMPARTAVIASLSKRSETGRIQLSPNELHQMAGRAGRRGTDERGHVVLVQTPFEGAEECCKLLFTGIEPLVSQFTASYGMVLNLLAGAKVTRRLKQADDMKAFQAGRTLEEARKLVEQSFGNYVGSNVMLSAKEELTKIQKEIELLTLEVSDDAVDRRSQKQLSEMAYKEISDLQEELRAEKRLRTELRRRMELKRMTALKPLLKELENGHLPFVCLQYVDNEGVQHLVPAVYLGSVDSFSGSKIRNMIYANDPFALNIIEAELDVGDTERQLDVKPSYYMALGSDNSWYLFTEKWIKTVYRTGFPNVSLAQGDALPREIMRVLLDKEELQWEKLAASEFGSLWCMEGSLETWSWSLNVPVLSSLSEDDEVLQVSRVYHDAIECYKEQRNKVSRLKKKIARTEGFKEYKKIIDMVNFTKEKIERLKARSNRLISRIEQIEPSGWKEFLQISNVIRETRALDINTHVIFPLGETAAAIRGENELWLAMVLRNKILLDLKPTQLAAVCGSLVSEGIKIRPWKNNSYIYDPSSTVINVIKLLDEQRNSLLQLQEKHGVKILCALDTQFCGMVEAWASGLTWREIMMDCAMDEGDLARLLRRTIDLLAQIPKLPDIDPVLQNNAMIASNVMDRPPISELAG
ncbi:hypothetical protein HHK36_024851 [Tetracentron sinense]|uniref:DExH-box ATP-dependent RNA helicase DExH15 chloroplastic n=1 Tax=Tetracentron sinense TaxID=13715 RepID=A0A834YNV4_TETSI|nr:hypothetical protein HHK36_024851 [Tetracentron sinense]